MGTKQVTASSITRPWQRLVVVGASVLMLTGCGALYDTRGFVGGVTGGPESRVNDAIAALAQGDWRTAEQQASQALFVDPANGRGLLVMGVVYQNTGRPAQARRMYEQLLSSDTSGMVATGTWDDLQPRPLKEVAEANLRLLDETSGVLLPRPEGAVMVRSATAPDIGELAAPPPSSNPARRTATELPVEPVTTEESENLLNRFRVLQRLLADDLITAEEYARRSAANIGALLPLTEKAPAVGLGQPVPTTDEVVNRLEALRRAFEGRAIGAGQHSAERTAILDGLLPADPRVRQRVANVPDDLLEAAAMMGRLEQVREEGLIAPEQFDRERAAIDKAIRPDGARSSLAAKAPAPPPKPQAVAAETPAALSVPAVTAPGGMLVPPPEGAKNPAALVRTGREPLEVVPNPTGAVSSPAPTPAEVPAGPENGMPGVVASVPIPPAPTTPNGVRLGAAVHLESYRGREDAEKGWEVLKQKFPELANLDLKITEVRVPGRGLYYRLNAGPLPSEAEARGLCARLEGQWCEPVFIGG